MFICSKCGICCRNIGGITDLADFHTGNGVCIHLTEDNLCDIYFTRPDICNVKTMYEIKYKEVMSIEKYEEMNMQGCKFLQRKEIGD